MTNKQNEENMMHCKTIIVGNSGVGKTSIISRYIRKFDPYAKSTIGASFTNKLETINGTQILFEIWDTAGQERFRSINSIFYQDAYICILVYDITNKQSFENIGYWIEGITKVKDNLSKILIYILANKNDKDDGNGNIEMINEGRNYALDNKYLIKSISAKDNEGIMGLIEESVEKYLTIS